MQSRLTKLVSLSYISVPLFSIGQLLCFAEPPSRTSHTQTQVEGKELIAPARLIPPIRIADAGMAGDGGTIFIELIDVENHHLSIRVSQNTWESEVPHDTLFLDAPNPRRNQDSRIERLPTSDDEVADVLRTLRLAIDSNKGSEHLTAKEALERLQRKTNYSLRDPQAGVEPDWYREYDLKRRKQADKAATTAVKKTRRRDCFPPDVRRLLEPSDGEPLSNEEIRNRAQKLSASMTSPTRLVVAACCAFGATHDTYWELTGESDLVIIQALKDVSVDQVVAGFEELPDESALLGASRICFDRELSVSDHLSETDWAKWIPRLAKISFSYGPRANHQQTLEAISRHDSESATLLLRNLANGKIGSKQDTAASEPNTIGIRDGAYLALALHKDFQAMPAIRRRLNCKLPDADRAALEVGMALLGEPSYLKNTHFEGSSETIALAALEAICRHPTAHSMDILMSSAIGPTCVIQDKAMLRAEQITGQDWVPESNTKKPRAFGPIAKDWWKANREAFLRELNLRDNGD